MQAPLLIVSDHLGARTYRVARSPQGTPRLQPEASFETGWIESEHHRPSPLVRRGVTVYGSREGELLEKTRHCARELANWIRARIQENGEALSVKVTTPVRLLGHVRDHLGDMLNGRVQLCAGEFTKVPLDRLIGHRAVAEWLESVEA